MDNFLVFRLYGPLAAWGKVAVGEVRPSYFYPSRSAILGLISAALGIKRDETDKLSRLFDSYDIAVKVLSPGSLLTDYHTVQVPDSIGKVIYSTRFDELVLGSDRVNTILTTREYRCDAVAIVALRVRTNPSHTLKELMEHLEKPKFVLYLGRKSCPSAVPLKPQIIPASGFKEALDNADFPPLVVSYSGEDATGRFIPMPPPRYYWEGDAGDMKPQETHERYDQPVNRERWQFSSRQEHVFQDGGQ
jgi:CRISPR system Cascade subunit CasD